MVTFCIIHRNQEITKPNEKQELCWDIYCEMAVRCCLYPVLYPWHVGCDPGEASWISYLAASHSAERSHPHLKKYWVFSTIIIKQQTCSSTFEQTSLPYTRLTKVVKRKKIKSLLSDNDSVIRLAGKQQCDCYQKTQLQFFSVWSACASWLFSNERMYINGIICSYWRFSWVKDLKT